jgi:hypothetical protein
MVLYPKIKILDINVMNCIDKSRNGNVELCKSRFFDRILRENYAPVAQVDRALASEAGCESSSLSRGRYFPRKGVAYSIQLLFCLR